MRDFSLTVATFPFFLKTGEMEGRQVARRAQRVGRTSGNDW
jgi:hypothetical protein